MKDKIIDYKAFLEAFEKTGQKDFYYSCEALRFARLLSYFGVKSIVPNYGFYDENNFSSIHFHGFSFTCRPNITIINRPKRLDASLLSVIGEMFKNFSCGCSGKGYMQGCFDIDMKDKDGKQLPFNCKKDALNLYVRNIFFYFLAIQEDKRYSKNRKL